MREKISELVTPLDRRLITAHHEDRIYRSEEKHTLGKDCKFRERRAFIYRDSDDCQSAGRERTKHL